MILNIQVIANLFFTILGLTWAVAALRLPDAAFGNPAAPKIYPLIIAIGMVVLSLWLFAAEMKKQKAGKAQKKASFKLTPEGRLVAFVSIGCIIYALVFETLGYIISTTVFIEAVMLYISKGKKMLVPTIVAILFSAGVYVVFGKLLGITLPPMPFLDF